MKKSRVVKTWSKHNVPEELWTEILSRLPVKSLLRFRCVCSSWRALIDDPDFARLHLTRFNTKHGESNLLFFHNAKCVLRCSTTLRAKATLGFLQTDLPSSNSLRATREHDRFVQRWKVSCSADGLFMLKNYTQYHDEIPKLMLWNPSIRKTRTLSLPPEICSEIYYFDFGLGFDPLLNDYKFVRCAEKRCSVSIYTIGTNSWKTIDFKGEGSSSWDQDAKFFEAQKTFCLRGVLYALIGLWKPPLNLVSFDLNKGKCASTPLPKNNSGKYFHALTTVDGGSSLAIIYLSGDKGIIYVLESLGDYTESLSWTQRYSFTMMMPDYRNALGETRFLYLKKNGEMLLEIPWVASDTCKSKTLTSFNLKTQKESILMKRISLEGYPCPYIQSLILL